jgi:drug/metabolite transporter superfamily protein YnfA
MIELLRDVWDLLRERKKLWLAPIIVVMLLVTVLLIVTQSSVIAPFIYSLF